MTLERIEHKVFASEAPLEEMGQFGSALATTKLNTKDVAEIQALPAYTKGWGSAIISENNYPAMEEMNGVLNVMSYHTGYLYQEGIPVYSSTQTYSATSMVKSLDGKGIYRSLKGDNKGNPLEDETSWELFDFSKGTLKTNQITDCITEIPQRIKYTLENGILTIKAGSVVIVPYGNEDLTSQYPKDATFLNDNFKVYDTQFEDGKFFVWAEVQNDTVATLPSTASETSRFVLLDLQTGSIRTNNSGEFASSGNVASSGLVYRTDLNKVEHYTTNLTIDYITGFPLMIAIANFEAGKFTSINKVFNGMGYIGSTVWVDKGVKGLIPNGRNEDGTLKNIEFTTPNLWLATIPEYRTDWKVYIEPSINGLRFSSGVTYISELNKNHYDATNGFVDVCYIGRVLNENGTTKVLTFNPKLPFRAVDYSDSSTVSGWGMPSSKYVDLTVGKIGSTYIAPTNGYFKFVGACTAVGYIGLENVTKNNYSNSMNRVMSASSSAPMSVWATTIASKGDVVSIVGSSNMTFVSGSLKFIYAEGEV